MSVKVVELAAPQLLGHFLNWALVSVLSVQVYFYHLLFRNDSLRLRVFVYTLFIVEWVQTILVTVDSFNKFAWNFGDVPNLVAFGSSWFTVPIMCGVVSAAVQIFYAHRLWAFSKSLVLSGIVCLLALMQGSAAIALGVLFKRIHAGTNAKQPDTTPVASVWLGGSSLVDIIIAVSMTFFLLKSKSGVRQSDSVIDKLARLIIESGMITATVAVIQVVLYAAFPGKTYFEAPAHVLSKLYVNTMITSLNNRAFLRMTPHVAIMPFSRNEPSSSGARTYSGSFGDTSEAVRVDVLRERVTDGEYPMADCTKEPTEFRIV